MGRIGNWVERNLKNIFSWSRKKMLGASKKQPDPYNAYIQAKNEKAQTLQKQMDKRKSGIESIRSRLEGVRLPDQDINRINRQDIVTFEPLSQEEQNALKKQGGTHLSNLPVMKTITGKLNGENYIYIQYNPYADGTRKSVIYCADGGNYEITTDTDNKISSYSESTSGKNGEKCTFNNNHGSCNTSVSQDGITFSVTATEQESDMEEFKKYAQPSNDERGREKYSKFFGLPIIDDKGVSYALTRSFELNRNERIEMEMQPKIDGKEQRINEITMKHMRETKIPSYDLEEKIEEEKRRKQKQKAQIIWAYRQQYEKYLETDDEVWEALNEDMYEVTFNPDEQFGEGNEVKLCFDSIDDFINGKQPKRIYSKNSILEGEPRV